MHINDISTIGRIKFYSDKPFEMYLVCNAYPDENANAVSRVSGEFKVFKSRSTNLDLGFVGIWLSILVLEILSSASCDAIIELTTTFSFWIFRCNLCQMESGVVDIIPVPIVPNCWWKVLTIFGWACPTRNKDYYQFTFSISNALIAAILYAHQIIIYLTYHVKPRKYNQYRFFPLCRIV